MGVPGFFAWILSKFKKKILSKHLEERPKYLYIDANCLFHPECFKILEYCSEITDIDKLEKLMFKRILNYLDYLENVVNPTEMMFVAVDGVAPLAKIGQQRKRRFKSVIDNDMKKSIKLKHGIKVNSIWSNTVITPGTIFMEKLHNKLCDHYKNRSKKKNIKYIYSSYHTPGEGEHKILQHVKKNTNVNDNIVIYGLDADLIFLAMTSYRNNIYLLREEMQITGNSKKEDLFDPVDDVAQDLLFVSISSTKEAYNEKLNSLISNNYKYKGIHENEEKDYSTDLIFICFLLGNDFLPHFPSIDIHKGGLESIINSYVDCVTDTQDILLERTLSNGETCIKINTVFLTRLIEKLGSKEYVYFKETLPKAMEHSKRKKCYVTGAYDREMWNINNMRTFEVKDPIGLGIGQEDEWKFRYYEHNFFVCEHQEIFIKDLVKIYLEGVMWVTQYYFNKCPTWTWQYPYRHAPFISDIINCSEMISNINNIKFDKHTNIPIMTQLLSVLPPQCNDILPNKYSQSMVNKSSPIIDLFPKNVKLDMLYTDLYWKCDPILPALDINRLIEYTSNIELSKQENIRNRKLKEFAF